MTLGGELLRAADRFSRCEALVFGERRSSYAGLLELVIEKARCLIGMGVKRHDHVGILMPNCWDYVILYYAVNFVGARAVLLNARYRSDDLCYVIPKAQVRWLFIGGHARAHCDYRLLLAEAFGTPVSLEQIRTQVPTLMQIVELGDDRVGPFVQEDWFSAQAMKIGEEQALAAAAGVAPEDVGLLIFSSGTTSRPKACMLTHLSLSQTGAAMAERFELRAGEKLWDPLPLFHMSTILPLAGCRANGACFIGMDHFDADIAVPLLIAERPAVHYAGFPAIIAALIDNPDFPRYDQSRLRINHVVGPPDLLRRFAGYFPGATPWNSYGLTEATGVPCFSTAGDSGDFLFETNGFLFDGMEAAIAGADGAFLPDGDLGEILLRGFALFAGYFDDDEATAKAIDAQGWLHTGDLGRIGPDGRLIYEGRLKDMLKIGGENVAAIEIESFLMTHPGVRMAQVIGVPDDRLMEVAAAYIEPVTGTAPSPHDLARYCKGRIASYKIPRYFRFVTEWPMSATKVQKFALRANFEPTGKVDVASL